MVSQSASDFNFEKCPAGNHIAVCFSVVDMGMQEVNFQGVISMKRKVRISWEIPGELMKEGEFAGKPFSISKNYTLSFHEKAVLYKDLISWRGRPFSAEELSGFDLFSILGAPCMVKARSTISIARSTPAQKPLGFASNTSITGSSSNF